MALAVIKREKTLAELAVQLDVGQKQIQDRKKQLLDQTDNSFGNSQEPKITDDAFVKDLHAKISDLDLDNDFVAKVLGR